MEIRSVSLCWQTPVPLSPYQKANPAKAALQSVCAHVCECLCVCGCKGPPLTLVKWGSFVMQQVLLSVNLS